MFQIHQTMKRNINKKKMSTQYGKAKKRAEEAFWRALSRLDWQWVKSAPVGS